MIEDGFIAKILAPTGETLQVGDVRAYPSLIAFI
jgi:pyruvate/2-oxoglutarate dehydrogenase complex dihydrolipoamide acyltransferase (E2) component